MNRRTFLRDATLFGTHAVVYRSVVAQSVAPPLASPNDPAKTGIPGTGNLPANLPTLREAAEQRGLLIGTAVAAGPLRDDPLYAEVVRQQANILVAENAMKFGPLRPTPETFAFHDADELFAFAASYGMRVRGHNFVWHRQLPTWLDAYATKENAAALLTDHIRTVGGRYAGRVHSWDVVNEAIELDDRQPEGLRNSPWLRLLGPTYIDLAFRTARLADPKALLCYNDYGLESESAGDAAKRVAVLNLLRGLQARGTPIDALGIQSHLSAGPNFVYGPGLQRFLEDVRRMGLKVLLTEMDVNDRGLPADIAARDRTVAETYAGYLRLTLANPAVTALLTWGLADKYTWLNGEGSRPDKLPERALPFDADLRPKLAYTAAVQAVQATSARAG